MDIIQVHREYRVQLDKLDTGTLPELESKVIDILLNDTIEEFIKTKYRPIEQIVLRQKGFEQIQKRIDDLRILVTTGELSSTITDNSLPTYSYNLKELKEGDLENYQFYLRGQLLIDSTTYRGIKIDTHDKLDSIELDPFNKSTIRKPRGYFEGNNIIIQKPEGLAIDFIPKLKVTYLRRFKPVSYSGGITIELPEHTHREIIRICVQHTLETLESGRLQTIQQKVSMAE